MMLRTRSLLLAALASLAPISQAREPLTQTTLSVYAGGKPVGGLLFPIGTTVEPSIVSNYSDARDGAARYTGNVQGRFTPPPGQSIILFGDDIAVDVAPISAARAQAVRDLGAMAGPDQLYRGRATVPNLTPDQWQRQSLLDAANMTRLAQILDTYGWPGLRFAGAASQTAFAVLQHADHASQVKYLPLMREAVRRNDALAFHLALLEDRVRVADGKRQLYGSQLSGDPLRIDPIEDELHVDARRKRIGLEPLAAYAKRFGVTYTPKNVAGSSAP